MLSRTVHGKPLVYLDSAATSQKPRVVIDALMNYYVTMNANVHRGVHRLSEEATIAYDCARDQVAAFINARSAREIVFVRNATEAINLVARAWGAKHLGPGDEIVLSAYEHHANLVPWQRVAAERGATLKFIPMADDQSLDLSGLDTIITPNTKLVGVAHVSNAFGSITPTREIITAARRVGAVTLLDGAQSVPHMPVDVQALGCDMLVASGHKMCAPMGIGFLWAREELLAAMDPFLSGGDMIRAVWYDHAEYNDIPLKFEAGTPNVADAIGLGAAVRYLSTLGMANVRAHERDLVAYALARFAELPDVTVYGPKDPDRRGGVISFTMRGAHPHDIGTIVDQEGVAIRAGHHCAQPAMRALGVSGTARASFYIYTTESEIDALIAALGRVREVFARAQ
ncbi:MAG: cysteine desulfurase [Dehalococcoidia bacterium]|nr:cysteine desulfurase [Dehalococcoidia bacterium]